MNATHDALIARALREPEPGPELRERILKAAARPPARWGVAAASLAAGIAATWLIVAPERPAAAVPEAARRVLAGAEPLGSVGASPFLSVLQEVTR